MRAPLTAALAVLAVLGFASSAQAIQVTTTAASGGGSLAAAITAANSTPAPDTITFALGNAGPYTIAMGDTPLPDITAPVTIDGFSQHGASPNTNALDAGSNAVMKVVVTGRTGIQLKASNSTIKGLVLNTADTNGYGSAIASTGSNNVIAGNYIGTDASGLSAPDSPDGYLDGVELTGDRTNGAYTNNRIGGPSPADRNVIAGDTGEDIRLYGYYDYQSNSAYQGSTNTVIQGNYIGTFASGTASPSFANTTEGINVFPGNTGTVIGGAGSGQGNVISGLANTSSAIGLRLGAQSNGVVKGNLIGTERDGTSPLGNGIEGIQILEGRNWSIGGTGPGEGNVIANNGYLGIQIKGSNDPDNDGDRNPILGNSIYNNGTRGFGAQGIDLSNTLNQADFDMNDTIGPDADDGPNEGQNYPVLTSTSVSGGVASITGTLLSVPNKTYRVEFFANQACNGDAPRDYGEGQTYLGFANVSTDGSGSGSFVNVTLPNVPAGQAVISATATDPDGNTSEFSKCVTAAGAPPSNPTPPSSGGGTAPPSSGAGSAPTVSSPVTPAPTAPAAPVVPSSFNALGAATCSRRAISLVRADSAGSVVVLKGLVGQGLANAKVTVTGNYRSKGKKAATTVKADAKGQFTARLPRPSKRGFAGARYTAVAGSARSIALRLTQSLSSSSIRQSGGTITLKGRIKKALVGKRNPVVIKRLVCGTYLKVASVKPKADGSYSATFAAPGLAGAALYRAESVVLVRPGAKKSAIQYARAIGITLTGQTG